MAPQDLPALPTKVCKILKVCKVAPITLVADMAFALKSGDILSHFENMLNSERNTGLRESVLQKLALG